MGIGLPICDRPGALSPDPVQERKVVVFTDPETLGDEGAIGLLWQEPQRAQNQQHLADLAGLLAVFQVADETNAGAGSHVFPLRNNWRIRAPESTENSRSVKTPGN